MKTQSWEFTRLDRWGLERQGKGGQRPKIALLLERPQPEPRRGKSGIPPPQGQGPKLTALLSATSTHRIMGFEIRGKCHSGSGTVVFFCVTDLQRPKEKSRMQKSDYGTRRTGEGDK